MLKWFWRQGGWGILASWLLLGGCTPTDEAPMPAVGGITTSALILNEGTFNYGNASISLFDLAQRQLRNDGFQTTNGRPLGDVLQSAAWWNNQLVLVLNNSNRVELVDPLTLESRGAITGLVSPRYLAVVPDGSGKAYLSDLYANQLQIVDLQARRVTGRIRLPGWTEEMVFTPAGLWVANRYRRFCYLINPQTDRIIDSLALSYGPGALAVDRAGKLWVYCAGDPSTGQAAGLWRCDPATRQILQHFEFPSREALYPRLELSPQKDTLYFLNRDLYALPIDATQLPTQPLLRAEGRNWYGLGVNPVDGHLWLADAKDFLQRGEVREYRARGQWQQSLLVGVGPNRVLFYR